VGGALNRVSRQQGAEVWTGSIAGEGPWQMSFVLECYGSPAIILLIVAIYLLIHMDRRADELDKECRRTAIETCGERRIKRYRVRRTLLSLTESEGRRPRLRLRVQVVSPREGSRRNPFLRRGGKNLLLPGSSTLRIELLVMK
jgi:hypothetical protein